MGWDGLTWVVCGMGMGPEAGTPFINEDHMGIHKNRDGDGMGCDYCVTRWGDAAGTAVSLAMWDCT